MLKSNRMFYKNNKLIISLLVGVLLVVIAAVSVSNPIARLANNDSEISTKKYEEIVDRSDYKAEEDTINSSADEQSSEDDSITVSPEDGSGDYTLNGDQLEQGVAWNPENTTQPPAPALSVSYSPELTQFVYYKYHPSADTKYYTVTSNNKIRSHNVTGYDTSKVSIKTNADMTNDTEIQFKIDLLADLNIAQVGQTAASVEITDEYNQISIIPIKVEWAIKDIVINLE